MEFGLKWGHYDNTQKPGPTRTPRGLKIDPRTPGAWNINQSAIDLKKLQRILRSSKISKELKGTHQKQPYETLRNLKEPKRAIGWNHNELQEILGNSKKS